MTHSLSGSWIGIDLGTQNSSAAVKLNGGVKIIRNAEAGVEGIEPSPQAEDKKEFPSYIYIDQTGSIESIGIRAKAKAYLHPEQVIWGVKRLLGRTFSELKECGELDRFPYRIRPNRKNGQCLIVVGERSYTPEQLCAEMLKTIAGEAEIQMKQKLDSVVVSVPAYFDPLRVTPIVDAARMAGFVHVKTIPEPVAAALAYDIDITVKPVRVLVFDLGAGTLDITAGYLFRNPHKIDEIEFHVVKNTGDTRLGGIDMDDRLTGLIMERCRLSEIGVEHRSVLRQSAENAKIRLSKEEKIEHLFCLNGVEYRCVLTRADLKFALQGRGPEKNLLEACRQQIMSALEESGWSPQEVELLLLIGGPTKLSAIQEVLEIVFHSNPRVLEQIDLFYSGKEKVDRMNAVSIGAALSVDRKVDDKVPAGYGLEVIDMDGEHVSYWPNVLVPRDSCYPYKSRPYLIPWVHLGGLFEFKIVQQAPKSEAEQFGYEYKFIGIQKFAVKNPNHCMIAVQMGYNANKELEVTIQNILSHESVTYVGMNQSANIGMAYPLIVKKPIHLEAAQAKKRTPAENTVQKFSGWVLETAEVIKRRSSQFPVPQMLITQILDEIELAIKKGPATLEFESVYTQVNSLIWNANSRGLLTQGQFIALTNRLAEFESELFISASE